MIAIVLVSVVALVLSYHAYLFWYVKSGRYEFDQHLDNWTKR